MTAVFPGLRKVRSVGKAAIGGPIRLIKRQGQARDGG